MDFVAIANTSASKLTEATGTGALTLTFKTVAGSRIEVVHIAAEDDGGEAVLRTIEVDGVGVMIRRKFAASATVGTVTQKEISANPIAISTGVVDLVVRLLAGGTIAVTRRLMATVRYIPDVEISSAGLG